ncbi:Gfo/Idh/MocA family oxidoreductase [Metabacillus sp. FJAT-53654]|uniref:Gfo/Idh/MocA family oxidoreductase n=1 Tax=Metabacillus rhizosphaerae TaxID=3117747 RepID=A0ABZ2MVR0_9BACI
MLNVAVVGSEKSTNDHLSAWSRIKNVNIVGVVQIETTENEQVSERYKHKLVEHVEDLKSLDVDVVDLCLPVNRTDIIRQMYREGLHIICESPLASTLEEASAIVKECAEKNVHLYVGNTLRFSPEYADARNQVCNGNIGKPGVIRLSSGMSHPGGQIDIFTGLGIPDFDWLTWTFGDVERVMAKHVKRERLNGSPIEYALVSLRLKDNTFAHIELSWAKAKKETSFELTGDKGMLTHNSKDSYPINVQLSPSYHEHKLEESILAKTALHRQLEHVAAWAETQNKPMIVVDDALKAIQIAEAARKSANTGQPVSLKGSVFI